MWYVCTAERERETGRTVSCFFSPRVCRVHGTKNGTMNIYSTRGRARCLHSWFAMLGGPRVVRVRVDFGAALNWDAPLAVRE